MKSQAAFGHFASSYRHEPTAMKKTFLLLFLALFFGALSAQTHFYIGQIAVVPAAPTTSDNVSIHLIGDLGDTGAFIAIAEADVSGNTVTITVVAGSNGGLSVLVPHTEVIELGLLPAGTYTIEFNSGTVSTWDMAPVEQHNFTVSNGNPCAELDLVSVQWQAFGDTALMVHVLNSSSSIFPYPNFILFNAQGDTLAKETVNLFGIGNEGWHLMRIQSGIAMPEEDFNGRLELWTDFTQVLACSWEQEFSLCPDEACSELEIHLSETVSPPVIGTYNWMLGDLFGGLHSGQFTLSAQEQHVSTTLCVPPGAYFLDVSPTDPGSFSAPRFYASASGGQLSNSGFATASLPLALEVNFYGPCASGTQSVAELGVPALLVRYTPGGVHVETSDGKPLGVVALWDMQGRLIFSEQGAGHLFVPLPVPGVYLIRAGEASVKVLGGIE